MIQAADIDLTWLPLSAQDFRLSYQTRTGGRSLSRREDYVFTDNGFWTAGVTVAPQFESAMRRLRSDVDRMRGRFSTMSIRVFNRPNLSADGDAWSFMATMGITEQEHRQGWTPFASGSPFASGQGWALPDQREPRAVWGAPKGARKLTVDGGITTAIEVGDMFSYGGNGYRVYERIGYELYFEPGLRVEVPARAQIEVSKPTMVMRLTDDDGAALTTNYNLWSSPLSLSLEEVRP